MANTGRVVRTEQLTPHMIRVVLGDLAGFVPNGFTDAYVKLLFPVPGVTYPEPFDMKQIRAEHPREEWPRMRTYTVRAHDEQAGELTIDFVYHGDEGLAGPWARNARPGDELRFAGPGGAYAPGDEADWHLLAGDESALPAIAAILRELPSGADVRVFVEVADAAEEQDLPATWLHRDGTPDLLARAVAKATLPEGRVEAWLAGERSSMVALRAHLLEDRGFDRGRVRPTTYWRRGEPGS